MKKTIIIIIVITLVIFAGGFAYYTTVQKTYNKKTTENLTKAKRIYDAIPIWHKKIHTNQSVRIGIINDTHVHPKRINRADERENAKRYLTQKDVTPIENFVAQMKKFQPAFIIHLGDVIEGTNDPDYVGLIGIDLVEDELEKLDIPMYWAIGNHDLRSVTKKQFKEALHLDSLQQSFDMGDYRFIILDANYNRDNLSRTPTENKFIRGKLPPEEIIWLKKQLETDKRVFVFMHHGAFADDTPGDIKEDTYVPRMKQSIDNAKELRAIFDEYRVDGFFNGHMEARRYEKGPWTAYYSFTGTKKSKLYPDSFYELTITNGVPDVTMYYMPQGSTEIKKVDFESGEK